MRKEIDAAFDRHQETLTEVFQPGGMESYVHRGCIPVLTLINNGYQRYYLVYLPHKDATEKSRMVCESQGYACYLDDDDHDGKACETLMIDEEMGNAFIERINKKQLELLATLPIWEQAYIRLRHQLRMLGFSI